VHRSSRIPDESAREAPFRASFRGVPGSSSIRLEDSASDRPSRLAIRPVRFAFTVAPHLQIINYRGCFSPFVGI
jgi:hypothetical protein